MVGDRFGWKFESTGKFKDIAWRSRGPRTSLPSPYPPSPLEDDVESIGKRPPEAPVMPRAASSFGGRRDRSRPRRRQRRGESSSSCSSTSLHPSKKATMGPDLESRWATIRAWGNQPLSTTDRDVFEIMEMERQRQVRGIELITSENFVCHVVLEALSSHLTNKYSEGMPGARYYGGNQYIDQIERLCCNHALAAFGLDSESWGVNVQPYSCTSANFAVYTGLLLPKGRIMGLELPSGGHVSHGYHIPGGKKISGASIFFESLSYKVNPHTGYIDYDKLEDRRWIIAQRY